MQNWVYADACPNVIKEVLFRAAERSGMMVTLVANQIIRSPPSKFLRQLQKFQNPLFSGFHIRKHLLRGGKQVLSF